MKIDLIDVRIIHVVNNRHRNVQMKVRHNIDQLDIHRRQIHTNVIIHHNEILHQQHLHLHLHRRHDIHDHPVQRVQH